MTSFIEIFFTFFKLGCTSFGGPIAHLGYFHREFVERRAWVDEETYADIVALCQFLPGPASSQVGMALGLGRGGVAGSIAAWLGFTLPSAILMTGFALGFSHLEGGAGYLHGLKIVALAVVAQALASMAKTLCPDKTRATIAALAALAMMALVTSLSQLIVIALGALAGIVFLSRAVQGQESSEPLRASRAHPFFFVAFLALLFGLPAAVAWNPTAIWQLASAFYRTGALVFGGGHVVLPLLKAQVVDTGWMPANTFLAGYGVAQAMPGPLFSLSAYLGASIGSIANPIKGALVGLVFLFLPSWLLIVSTFPYWNRLRRQRLLRSSLLGVNAAVVGILLAAFYDPIWTNTIFKPMDFAFAVMAIVLLTQWKIPAWGLVIAGAAAGGIFF